MGSDGLVIRGGQVLDQASSALVEADILVEGDSIAAVGPGIQAPPGARVIDARDRIAVPGLVNCHTHAHNNLLKGVRDNLTLEEARAFGPAIFAGRTPEEQYVSAAIGAVEMVRTGSTAAFDMFTAMPLMTAEGVEAVVRAYADVGLRAVLGPSMNDDLFWRAVPGLLDLLPPDLRRAVGGLAAAPTEALLRIKRDAIRRWDGTAEGRIRMAAAPVVPGECSDDFLAGCVALTRDYGVRLQTHLAETKIQALYGMRRWGKTLVGHLHDVGMIGPHFVGGHGVWLTDDDIRMMGGAGASIAHNPASNLRLGSGIAPIREMLDAGVGVGLGSDGSMSSDNQNMFEAMRFAALVNKVRFPHDPERWLGASAIWEMATTHAARVLGLGDQIGAITPGRKADLVLLRVDSPFLRPMNDALSAFVYAETGADVDSVLIGGRVVLDRGRIVTVDETQLRARAQVAADRLRRGNAEAWALAERLRPFLRAACRACAAQDFPVNRYAATTD